MVSKQHLSLPLTLTRRRIYILPSRYGYFFLLILLAMLFGSINYNNNLGFLLTFLLGSLFFVSIFHTYRNMAALQVQAVKAKPVFVDEKANFDFLVRRADLACYALEFRFGKDDPVKSDLLPGIETWVSVPVMAARRGWLRPDSIHISTIYPLGLFRAWSPLQIAMECLVFPRPLFTHQIYSEAFSAQAGEGKMPVTGVEDFWGLNTYQPGDPPQRIFWKAYSRSQQLVIKEYNSYASVATMIDWEAVPEQDLEIKLSRMCAMVLQAESRQELYGLKLPGVIIPPGNGEQHKFFCLKSLALF